MFTRGGKVIVIALLVVTTGAHWIALQTVAWTTMLAANLTTSSFSEAVSDTFDGDHPCPLCKAIAAGKKAERKSKTVALELKMEFPPLAEGIRLFPPSRFELLSSEDCIAKPFSSPPLLPPPRSSFI